MFKIMLPFKFVQTVFWPWGGHRHANVTLSIHFDSFVVVFVIVKTTWTRLLGTFTQYKSYWNKDTPMNINMIWNDFFLWFIKKNYFFLQYLLFCKQQLLQFLGCFYSLIWYFDPSVLTTFALIGLAVSLIDFLVPIIGPSVVTAKW